MHCVTLFALYLLFLPPPSLSIDTKTADDTAGYNYFVDDQTPSVELPGKHPPFDHPDIAYSFPLLLTLE